MSHKPYVLGAIFARGGSKGVPRKNIRPLASKPLIYYAIQRALASKWISRLVVSTDDEEIATIAQQYGAEVPFMRPAELAADDSPELLSWRHLIQTLQTDPGSSKIEAMCSVPCTAPLGLASTVDAAIERLFSIDADVVVTVRKTPRNPYFGSVTLDEKSWAKKLLTPPGGALRRQDVPAVYEIIPVAYAVRPSFVLRHTALFDGKVQAVELCQDDEGVDIDTEFDFNYAEFLLSRRTKES